MTAIGEAEVLKDRVGHSHLNSLIVTKFCEDKEKYHQRKKQQPLYKLL